MHRHIAIAAVAAVLAGWGPAAGFAQPPASTACCPKPGPVGPYPAPTGPLDPCTEPRPISGPDPGCT